MPKSSTKLTTDQLGQLIYEIRGERVMLDSDLASIYGVETKALNRAVNRNRDRFPKDFVFQLSENEWKNLRYQIGTSSSNRKQQSVRYQIGTSSLSHGGRRSRPYVFTEHGAIMAANVLNSRRAVQMSVFVVRAFLKMRALLGDKRELAQKLAALEKELKKRLDVHEAVIVTILQRVMDIIDPPALPTPVPKPRIGFTP
jgi:phage regulator Rha-like protein